MTKQSRLSEAQQVELWRRHREEQNCSEIGRALGRAPGTIWMVLAKHGGVSPGRVGELFVA